MAKFVKIKKVQIERVCENLGIKLINYKFLSKGNHNINYYFKTNKGEFVLRIENNRQFKNLNKEYKFLKLAKPGLGPKAFLYDKSHKIIPRDYLVEEFLQGKHPSKKPSKDFVIRMAKWFKKLHSSTKKASFSSLTRQAKPYFNNCLKYNYNIKNEKLREELILKVNKAMQTVKENNKIFSNRKTYSLLHNDSSNENILYDPGCVRLIDWEFVGYGFPERELVYFIDSYDLTRKQISLFLKAYNYPKNEKAMKQLKWLI